ncbi:hypothetical protein [uncultured Salegentibacter sp.]|uniref:hypothetical protein n=1 Tax=uncultured Salegentibacter sp. TaxID=259320 RepID=UPI002599B809|nr:hypothetical protein [uncultured Salegentibacter sp.]
MKNITFLISFLFIGLSAKASESIIHRAYNDAFIFIENGVEFAVYPNGEFDFYYNPDFRSSSVINISTPNMNISYNSGYNYDAYVQYDDYGAVIQIESVPIYYDYYGRIIRAGNVFIDYNRRGHIARVGGLYIHYNRFNRITNYTGFINHYNSSYVYRPWHRYYSRPRSSVSIVFGKPYRAYYQPNRVTYVQHVSYYNNYYTKNVHQNFYRPNQKRVSYNKGRRTSGKRDLRKIRNKEAEFASRGNSRRSNIKAQRSNVAKSRKNITRSKRNTSIRARENNVRSYRGTANRTAVKNNRTRSKTEARKVGRESRNTAINRRSNSRKVNASGRNSRTVKSTPTRRSSSATKASSARESRTTTRRASNRNSNTRAVKSSNNKRSSARTSNSSSRGRSSARNVDRR